MRKPLLFVIFEVRQRRQKRQTSGYSSRPGEAGAAHPPPRPGFRKTDDIIGFDERPNLGQASFSPGPAQISHEAL